MEYTSNYYSLTNNQEKSDLAMNNQDIKRIKSDSSQQIKPSIINNITKKYGDIFYYINLEILPIGKTLNIVGLYPCAFDDENDLIKHMYRYSTLNEIFPEYFDNEYYKILGDEYVSPMVVLTDTKVYRTHPVLWIGLKEVYLGNKARNIFPISINISSHKITDAVECDWIYRLLTIVNR